MVYGISLQLLVIIEKICQNHTCTENPIVFLTGIPANLTKQLPFQTVRAQTRQFEFFADRILLSSGNFNGLFLPEEEDEADQNRHSYVYRITGNCFPILLICVNTILFDSIIVGM